MKKLKYIILIFLLSFCFLITSNATEAIGEDIKSEVPELIENGNLTSDNYYKYNEELHNNSSIERKVYNTDANTLSLEEYIIQKSLSCPEYIDVSAYQIPFDDAREVLIPFLYYDELFYIDAIPNWKGEWIEYDYETQTGTAILSEVYFRYTLTPEQIQEAWNVINREVKIYKAGIKSEWNELEKVLYTNDFLCKKCEYATDIINSSHTLYGALVDKKPVCDGFSHAFRYLLKQIGMEASIATSNSMNHAWNLVKIDNEYYHIDVTWNDTLYNGIKGVGITAYEFFLASDNAFENERKVSHNNWVADYNATSTKYDGNKNWRNQTNYLIYKDNYWYFIENNINTYTSKLCRVNLRSENLDETVVKGNLTSDYIFVAPGLTTDGVNLYYSTEYKIYQMDYNGENLKQFFEVPDNTKCIYSLEIKDNVFYYDTFDEKIDEGYKIADPQTRKTNICDVYEPEEEILVYTTINTTLLNEKEVMLFNKTQKISDLLISDNFPIIDKNYIVEVYSADNKLKSDTDQAGSKNTIKILNASGNLIKEYTIIVKGDVNGDGQVKMYDAFTILKGALFGESLDTIDVLIRDYNDDGEVKMYDAFSFLKYSLFN